MISNHEIKEIETRCAQILDQRERIQASDERTRADRRHASWLDRQPERLSGWKASVRAAYADQHDCFFGKKPAPDAVPESRDRLHVFQAGAALLVGVYGVLFTAVGFYSGFSLGMLTAAVVGALFFLTWGATAMAMGALVAARYVREPQSALARLERTQRYLFALLVAGASGLLIAGVLPPTLSLIRTILNLAIVVTAVSAPLLAGLLLATADIRAWSARLVRNYQRLERLERAVADLRAPAAADESVAEEPATNRDASGFQRAAVASLLVFAVTVPAWADPVSPPAGQPSRAQIWIDDSGSADQAMVARRLDDFFRAAPTLAGKGVGSWELFRFVEYSFEASPVFIWHVPAFTQPKCKPLTLNEREKLLKVARDRAQRLNKQECDRDIATARTRFDNDRARNVQGARQALSDPLTASAGRCTALRELLTRLAGEPAGRLRMAVVVTDGVETCHRGPSKAIPAPPRPLRVVMVTVPAQASGVPHGEQYESRRRYWSAIAPWVDVVPGNQFELALGAAQ